MPRTRKLLLFALHAALPVMLAAFLLVFITTDAEAQWANEPAGSTVVADCDFNDGSKTCGGVLTTYYPGGGVVDLADAPYSPSGVYYNRLPVGATTGDGSQLTFTGSRSMKDMYVGFYWKMNADFEGYPVGNKLFFMRDSANPDPTPGCSTNGLFGIGGTDGIDQRNPPFHIGWNINTGGLDNSGNPTCNDGWSNGVMCPPNVNDVPLNKDTWYLIEAYVKASSCPTCKDGIIRWWVDGQLVGDVTGYNYGCGTVNEFVFDHTWDGSITTQCRQITGNPLSRDCTREWYHYMDHLHIAAPDCPGGCPVTGATGMGTTKVEKGKVCEPVPDVELYVDKDKPAPVGQTIRDAIGGK